MKMETPEKIRSLLARKLPTINAYDIKPIFEQKGDRVPYVIPYSSAQLKSIRNTLEHVGWNVVDVTPMGALLSGSLLALHGDVEVRVSIVGLGGPTVLSARGSVLISENEGRSMLLMLSILVKGWTLTDNPTLAEVLGHPLLTK